MITFHTDAYENISYFNEVAVRLLTLMGHSAAVPGALKAEEVADALARLQKSLRVHPDDPSLFVDEEAVEPEISLRHRAIPLIYLLEAAVKKNCAVLWS